MRDNHDERDVVLPSRSRDSRRRFGSVNVNDKNAVRQVVMESNIAPSVKELISSAKASNAPATVPESVL